MSMISYTNLSEQVELARSRSQEISNILTTFFDSVPLNSNMLSLNIDPLKYLSRLPEFSGDYRDLQNFIDLVDKIYPTLLRYDELAQNIFSDHIKAKLKGKAREVIEINSHVTSWSDIKNTLIRNFGDRFTAEELFDELRAIKFKTNSVEFYNEIKNILRRLNVKSKQTIEDFDDLTNIIEQNKTAALVIFKNKLPEPMRSVIHCRNPNTLEEAMNILYECNYAFYNPLVRSQQYNASKATSKEQKKNFTVNNNINQRPNQTSNRVEFGNSRPPFPQNQYPPRQNFNSFQRPFYNNSNTHFYNSNNSARPDNNNFRFRFGNNNNHNNHRERPEPMEVDLVRTENGKNKERGQLGNFQLRASNTNYPI